MTGLKLTGTVHRWCDTTSQPRGPSDSARTSDSVRPVQRDRYPRPAEREGLDHTCCLGRSSARGLRPVNL